MEVGVQCFASYFYSFTDLLMQTFCTCHYTLIRYTFVWMGSCWLWINQSGRERTDSEYHRKTPSDIVFFKVYCLNRGTTRDGSSSARGFRKPLAEEEPSLVVPRVRNYLTHNLRAFLSG